MLASDLNGYPVDQKAAHPRVSSSTTMVRQTPCRTNIGAEDTPPAPRLQVIPAQYEHIAPVAIHMRQADRDEVYASSGKSPFEALEFSLAKSTISGTVLVNDRPAGMFGCGDLNMLARVGAPWLLGTDDLLLARREFLRTSVDWRGQLLQRYDVLRNLVDDRNAASIRWLKWLGFEFSEPHLIGVDKVPFRIFQLRR